MKIQVGVSNRHVHLDEQDFIYLFGKEKKSQEYFLKNLYQPNEYATELTVQIKTEKAVIDKVRVLGPNRSYTQVEISKTDAYKLGINPPIRESGDLSDAEEIIIKYQGKELKKRCCIIPNRHIHITSEEKEKLKLPDIVSVKTNGEKSIIFNNVFLKVCPKANLELHIDTDDANAALLKTKDMVEIIF